MHFIVNFVILMSWLNQGMAFYKGFFLNDFQNQSYIHNYTWILIFIYSLTYIAQKISDI